MTVGQLSDSGPRCLMAGASEPGMCRNLKSHSPDGGLPVAAPGSDNDKATRTRDPVHS